MKKQKKTPAKKQSFRIYISHTIRGIKGDKATQNDINENIEHAKRVGVELQAYAIDWEKMDGFPPIDIYVPADHDEFVLIAYNNGFLTETEILTCDCGIINRCDLLIMYGEPYSKGMQVEYEFAVANNIPVFKMPTLCKMTIEALQFVIHLLLLKE